MQTQFPNKWGEILTVYFAVSFTITHSFLSRWHRHASSPGGVQRRTTTCPLPRWSQPVLGNAWQAPLILLAFYGTAWWKLIINREKTSVIWDASLGTTVWLIPGKGLLGLNKRSCTDRGLCGGETNVLMYRPPQPARHTHSQTPPQIQTHMHRNTQTPQQTQSAKCGDVCTQPLPRLCVAWGSLKDLAN